LFLFKLQTNNRPNTPNFGGVILSGTTVGDGSAQVAWVIGTAALSGPTAPQDLPANERTTETVNGAIESAIWNFDASTNQLSMAWVNYGSDPSSPYTGTMYYDNDSQYPGFGLTSSAVTTPGKDHYVNAYPIYLVFQPSS